VKNLINRLILPIAAALAIGVPAWGSFVVPNGSITAAKISDGAVTPAKLAGRANGTTVGAGGIAISSSSGDYTLTASLASVPNLSVTITTVGRPVRIFLISGTTSTATTSSAFLNCDNGGAGACHMNIAFLRDGVVKGASTFGWGSTGALYVGPMEFIDTPSTGTYTYTVQAVRTSSGGGIIRSVKLVAYEL
jgi:hypothetical protein